MICRDADTAAVRKEGAAGGEPVDRRAVEEELVRAHLPLIQHEIHAVLRRVPRHVPADELASAAMFGLVQAARSFDPGRGVPFGKFAATRIRGALLDELRSRDWASRSVRTRSHELRQVSERLTARLGYTPSLEELAAEVRQSASDVQQLLDDVHRAVIVNLDSGPDGEIVLPADGTPEQEIIDRERKGYLRDAVEALPSRLRTVVVRYFFEERPMQEIADELGVTESRVSQMRAEALALLKDGMTAQLDPEALPAEARPDGRIARRKAAYYAAVAARSDYRARLDLTRQPTADPAVGTRAAG